MVLLQRREEPTSGPLSALSDSTHMFFTMKLSALAALLLCLNQLWVTPSRAAEDAQREPLDAENVTLEVQTLEDPPEDWFSRDNKTADADSSRKNCTKSFHHVVKYLNLYQDKEKFAMVRPVKDPTSATNVTLDVAIYAILDVEGIHQKFTSYLWTTIVWKNDFIQWDPEQFCGIESVAVSAEALWKPDIIIQDMIDKEKPSSSPYLVIAHNGLVGYMYYQVVVSTCRIRAYKFPFDTQTCDLSFKSAIYSDSALNLTPSMNSSETTKWSRETMKTQYEWIFLNLTVKEEKNTHFISQDVITYTIQMKRRSGLYVVNYIMPLMFFLSLDFASFLISDTGEKLGFKITVLLAVTVMQLLFNEILPSASDRIPLISVFCVGIFTLMLLSLLESLLMLCLRNKGENQQQEPERDDPYKRLKDAIDLSISFSSDSTALKAELNDNVLSALNNLRNKDEAGPGYWTKKSIMINRIFIVFYTTAVVVFLGTIFYRWLS